MASSGLVPEHGPDDFLRGYARGWDAAHDEFCDFGEGCTFHPRKSTE